MKKKKTTPKKEASKKKMPTKKKAVKKAASKKKTSVKKSSKAGKLTKKIKEFQKQLYALQIQTIERLGGLSMETVDEGVRDLVDQASNVEEMERVRGISSQQQLQLEQIETALKRIDSGSFGKCVECGKEIGKDRLEYMPYTPSCIECKKRNHF